jgi:hypothetical protein
MSFNTQGRLATLMARKAQLESALLQEQRSIHPDHLRISAIKRQKLHIKEEIHLLSEAS